MIDQRPILIAGPPRSGTTMIAGLLHYHGVWVGNTRVTRYPGTNPPDFGSENIDIKQLMKQEASNQNYSNWNCPFPVRPDCDFTELKTKIQKYVPENVKWMVKTSWLLIYYEFWKWAYPKALWIFTKRNTLAIFDSMNRHPGMAKNHSDKDKLKFIDALKIRQQLIASEVKRSYPVDVKKVSMKNDIEIMNLFEYLSIRVNWDIVDDWIKPENMQ